MMPNYQISLKNFNLSFACSDKQNILQGMARLMINGIPIGCRGGGCGVCKVKILEGEYQTQKMSRAHVSEEEESQGYVLACRCNPASDITLEVLGHIKTRVDKNK